MYIFINEVKVTRLLSLKASLEKCMPLQILAGTSSVENLRTTRSHAINTMRGILVELCGLPVLAPDEQSARHSMNLAFACLQNKYSSVTLEYLIHLCEKLATALFGQRTLTQREKAE